MKWTQFYTFKCFFSVILGLFGSNLATFVKVHGFDSLHKEACQSMKITVILSHFVFISYCGVVPRSIVRS